MNDCAPTAFCPRCGKRMNLLSDAGHRVRVCHTLWCVDCCVVLEFISGYVRLYTYTENGELRQLPWWGAREHGVAAIS